MVQKLQSKVKVKNPLGLHTRPATVIVQMLQNCKSQVSFTYRRETVNAHSILSILMLAVKKNGGITITVEGSDEEAPKVMDQLVEAFRTGFGEEV